MLSIVFAIVCDCGKKVATCAENDRLSYKWAVLRDEDLEGNSVGSTAYLTDVNKLYWHSLLINLKNNVSLMDVNFKFKQRQWLGPDQNCRSPSLGPIGIPGMLGLPFHDQQGTDFRPIGLLRLVNGLPYIHIFQLANVITQQSNHKTIQIILCMGKRVIGASRFVLVGDADTIPPDWRSCARPHYLRKTFICWTFLWFLIKIQPYNRLL